MSVYLKKTPAEKIKNKDNNHKIAPAVSVGYRPNTFSPLYMCTNDRNASCSRMSSQEIVALADNNIAARESQTDRAIPGGASNKHDASTQSSVSVVSPSFLQYFKGTILGAASAATFLASIPGTPP